MNFKKASQKKRFDKLWRSLNDHLLAYSERFDRKDLHLFRVKVKKSKAVLRFLLGKQVKKHLTPLQAVYRHAGSIRSAEIHVSLIPEFRPDNDAFKAEQEQLIATEIKRFRRHRNAYKKQIQYVYEAVTSGFHDIPKKAVSTFFKKQLNRISRFFAQAPADYDGLHEVRKKIKQLLYLHEWLPKRVVRKWRLDTNYLDKLQDVIGSWNDAVTLRDLLIQNHHADKKTIAQLNRRISRMYRSILLISEDFKKKAVMSPGQES